MAVHPRERVEYRAFSDVRIAAQRDRHVGSNAAAAVFLFAAQSHKRTLFESDMRMAITDEAKRYAIGSPSGLAKRQDISEPSDSPSS